MTSRTFERVALGALLALCAIVVTGSLVRLTGSGLGCEDWPRCSETKFIDVSSGHTAIEQINRLFTGVVSASVVLAVLGAHRHRPRRPSLVFWAWTLVIGVLGQVILGGVVVLTGLHPLSNIGHFLLSMVLVMAALVLLRRAQQSEDRTWWRNRSDLPGGVSLRILRATVLFAALTVVAGTVVTATGPHAGDEEAPRFGFDLSSVTRLHTGTMIVMLVLLVMLWTGARRAPESAERTSLMRALSLMGSVIAVQATVGYWQYLTGVPAGLVAVHVAGATAFWLSAVNLLAAPGRSPGG